MHRAVWNLHLAAFELLTTTDFMRAGQLAQQLDVQNRQRQVLTRTMQEQAELDRQ